MQADEICDFLRVLELCDGSGIHSLVVLLTLKFDSDNKETGYIITTHVSCDASRQDL